MDQVEIVRKTREMFEDTGVIPDAEDIDPFLKLNPDCNELAVSHFEVADMLSWEYSDDSDKPEELQCLKGFFTENSSHLFRDTMLTGNRNTYVCFFHFK
jgi:hypothetical protein